MNLNRIFTAEDKDTDEARDAITQQRCRLAREGRSRGQIQAYLSVDAGNCGPPLHLLGVFGQGNTTNTITVSKISSGRADAATKKWLDSAAADPAGSFLARWVIPIIFAYFSAKYSKTGKTLLDWRARKTHQNSLLRFEFRRDFAVCAVKKNMDQLTIHTYVASRAILRARTIPDLQSHPT